MAYALKGGEQWHDGQLYGWTGRKCEPCRGNGNRYVRCVSCGGTGDEWGLMPVQPIDAAPSFPEAALNRRL